MSNGSLIDNTLSIALGTKRVWFTEWTANYVGFVNTSYRAPFSVSASNQSLVLGPGEEAPITLRVAGNYSGQLRFQFSDSELFSSIPKNVTMTAGVDGLPSLSGVKSIPITVKVGKAEKPGVYRLLITVNGGLILQSVYILLRVS